VLQQAISVATKKNDQILIDKKKEIDKMQVQKAKILKLYNEKIHILRTKGTEIQDLIDKARAYS